MMKDETRTKKELIDELKILRRELSGLKRPKEPERIVKENLDRHRALFEHMLDGAAYHEIVVDKNNKPTDYIFLEVNDAFETHTGLKKKDVIGKRVTEIIPGIKKAKPDLISIYGKVALTGKGITFDLFFEPFNRWYCVSAYSPKRGFFAAIFEEITERKLLEEGLIKDNKVLEASVRERTAELAQANKRLIAENIERRHKEEALTVAQEFGMMGNWVHNLQTEELTWSEQIFRLFGLEPYEIEPTYETYLNFIHPDDKELVSKSGEMSYREYKPYDIEFRVIRKDGEERVFHSKAKIINDKEGNPLMRVGVNQDITERKKAGEALKESEERFRDIVENSEVWIWEVDFEGRYTYSSPIVEKILGYTPEEMVGKYFYEFVNPDERDILKEKIHTVFSKKEPFLHLLTKKIHKDGTILFCDTTGVPIIDEDGKLIGYRGSVSDITKRKKTEEALSEAKETYEGMFLNSMVGMSRTRLTDGKFLEINDRLVEMFGYDDRDDFIANYSAIKCYAIEGERDRALALMKETGEIENFETLARKKDGSTFWIQYSGRVNKEEGYLDAVSLDIDEQRRAQEELKKNEELLQNIIDNTTSVVYVKDLDGKYLLINRIFEELFHIDRLAIFGKRDHDIFPEDMADAFRANDKEVLDANTPVEFEEVAPHEDGPHTYISIKFPIDDNDGKPYAVCGISTDITERKRTAERIENLNKCFLEFGTDPTENIIRLTYLLGSLMKGTCALYNRIDDEGMLSSIGQWQTPPDYNPVDKPDGHICYDVITNKGDDILYVPNLSQTTYAKTDTNVVNYNLKSYLGKAVTSNGVHIGSLCVVFQEEFIPTEEDRKYLEIIAVAVGIEEERKQAGEELTDSREKLRNLSLHLQTMQEQERARIARDI
ncbi:MAG: PAS domain S-box protein, partial [Thermodesulfobacteriota bacterium]